MASYFNRLTIEVCGGTGCRGRGIGDSKGIGAVYFYETFIDSEGFSGDLDHFGIDALAHFYSSRSDEYAAVSIDVNKRSGLVEHGFGERNSKADGHDGKAFFD